MLNRFSISAAAILAISGAAAFGGDDPANSANSDVPTILPYNSVEQEAQNISSTNGVQQAAAQLAQAAVSGNLKDISQFVCEADRPRIARAGENQSPDQKLMQFRQDWHEKYGSEFTLPDAVAVLTNPDVQIQSGDLDDRARTAGEKIPANNGNAAPNANGNKSPAGSAQSNPSAAANSGTSNPNGVASQNKIAADSQAVDNTLPVPIATIIIPPNHDLPTVTARFINESQEWKIDIPNNLDGRKLLQNLDDELGKLDDHKASWSEDPKQAQLMVVQAVLAAMTDARNISNIGKTDNSTPH